MANVNDTDVSYYLRAYDSTGLAHESARKELEKTKSASEKTASAMQAHWESFRRNWLAAAASITAAYLALRKAWDFAEVAAQYEEQQRSLQALAAQYNLTADAATKMAKAASGGQLSLVESSQLAAQAFQLGFNPQTMTDFIVQAEKLTDVVGGEIPAAVEAMERAAATGRSRALVQYGIIVDLNKALAEYAQKHGISKEAIDAHTAMQIRANAILEEAKLRTDALGESEMSTADKMNVMRATVKDIELWLGQVTIKAAAAAAGAFQTVAAAITKLYEYWAKAKKGMTMTLMFQSGASYEEAQKATQGLQDDVNAANASAADLIAQASKNFDIMLAKEGELAAAMAKRSAAASGSLGADEAKLKAVEALNARLRQETEKTKLSERDYLEWQAKEYAKQGADRIILEEWKASKISELQRKEAEDAIKIENEIKKAREQAFAEEIKARSEHEKKIDDYKKKAGYLSDETYAANKYARERELYYQQIDSLNVQMDAAKTAAQILELEAQRFELEKKIIASREYQTFDLEILQKQRTEDLLKTEEKILEIKRQQIQAAWDGMMATNNLIGSDAGKYLGQMQTGMMGMASADADEQKRQEQRKALDAAYGDKLMKMIEAGKSEMEINQTVANHMAMTDKLKFAQSIAGYRAYANAVGGILGTIAVMSGANAETIFYINQANALANAFMNTAQGVTSALAGGPLTWPLVPWIEAIGAAQIAVIAAQTLMGPQTGSSASVSMPAAGGYSYEQPTTPSWQKTETTEAKSAPTINITIMGNMVGNDEYARELAVSIRKAWEDNVH